MFIATLIAAVTAGGTLAAGDLSAAMDRLAAAGCAPSVDGWIDEARAADIWFGANLGAARAALEGTLPLVDVVVQPVVAREKKLLLADMDSTMITVECIDELADYAGVKAEVAAVTESAMRGEMDFEAAIDARVALLAGLGEGAIDRCLAERVSITSGARALVRTMRSRGAKTVLVSGGFTRFADPVAAEIGFDRAVANVLGIHQGKLDGTVARPIVGAQTKVAMLRETAAANAIPIEATLAVGDGANDLKMIGAAGLGVAYHAKPVVAAAADARIDHGDLTALLHAQGIAMRDWVA